VSGAERTLALDPGGTTGWAVFDFDDTRPLEHVTHGMQAGGLAGFVEHFPLMVDVWRPTRVVFETFVLDGRTAFPDLTPLQIEGALAALWRGPLVGQRNTFKRFAPDGLLKAHGLWWPGKGHDRDAARHAIAERVTAGHKPTLALFHPDLI
jgi:hypothetical protein